MQLILDAENSEINIREKMTTVEDSISKLTNGVEIEKTPEKEIESKAEKENSLNGDNLMERETHIESVEKTVVHNFPVAPYENEDISENTDTKNGDIHAILDGSEPTSKNESNGESRVDIIVETEINLDNNKDETPKESPEEDHHNKENFEEKAHDEPEDPSKQQNDVKKLKTEDPIENVRKSKSSDDSKEVIENNFETEDPMDNASNTNDIIKPDDEKKLETQVHEENLHQTNKEIDMEANVAEKNADLSEMIEKENKEEQDKETADSGDLEPNVDSQNIVNKGNEEVQVSATEDCSNVVSEPNLDSEITNKISIMSSSEPLSDNTASHIPTPVSPVDTEPSAKSLENEISNVKEADMDCDVTPSSVETPKESAPIPMDCDNLDLIENDKNKSVMDHEVIADTATQEETQVDHTNSLAVEAINQVSVKENDVSLMDHDAINETDNAQVEKTDSLAIEAVHEDVEKVKENIVNKTTETKEDIPEISVPTVEQEIETTEEDVTKVKEATENATEGKETSSLEEVKEIVVQENSVPLTATSPSKDVNSDIEEVKVIDINMEEKSTKSPSKSNVEKPTPTVCKLSNTLNILSDDEDEPPKKEEIPESIAEPNDKQCINIEDDDDVMVIEDTATQDKPESVSFECTSDKKENFKSDSDSRDAQTCEVITEPEPKCNDEKESLESKIESVDSPTPQITEKETQEPVEEKTKEQPLLPKDIFKSYRKNLTEMTRDDLEEFCIVKIVESIIDRSSLNEIKTRLKTMSQTMEEYKKKAMMLTKQNRDLQVVLKSVQEEQKKGGNTPIVPLKITRSVGMQVLMTDKNARRKVNPTPAPGGMNANNRVTRVNQSPRPQAPITNQQIPVPRLVPATNTAPKPNPVQVTAPRSTAKPNSALSNGVRSSPPVPKAAEKRTRVQSVTVDLTDDEPPPKIPANKTSPAPPVRLVPSQNLLTPRAQMASNTLNNPRKVYIPIGSNQNQNRPALMLKNIPNPGPRPRGAAPMGPRGQSPNQIRMTRVNTGRHPAPLPDAVKQYQPPNWKALPPAPDLKLSKVENGIVISWKIDGYQEDSYEEIASYQLYAYQETSSPPQTSLWKKIGDVKALPLPMACTLTQFMAGYKYYFAVRAVDVRSRLGPFSLPGSILLLNKM